MNPIEFQGPSVPVVRAGIRAAPVPVDDEGSRHLHDLQRRLPLMGIHHRPGRGFLGLPGSRSIEPHSGKFVVTEFYAFLLVNLVRCYLLAYYLIL